MINFFKRKPPEPKPMMYPLDPKRIVKVVYGADPYCYATIHYGDGSIISFEEYLDKKIDERLAKLK